MKFFQWFDTGEVDALAEAIAADLVQRVPPARLESKERKDAVRLRHAHDAIFARAAKFARSHKLNVYTKARLGNQFRWALQQGGYPREFVEAWTHELINLIALARARD